jgi:phosphoenolpyruvate synthase/pyruvate phosphate dikinase
MRGLITINASSGFGEVLVRGDVSGNTLELYGPWLSDPSKIPILNQDLGDLGYSALRIEEILNIAREAWRLHQIHAKDNQGVDFEVAISPIEDDASFRIATFVQKRPNTSDETRAGTKTEYVLTGVPSTEPYIGGVPVNSMIGSGPVRYINYVDEIDEIQEGDIVILQTAMPEFNGVFRRRPAGVITLGGGKTSHFAIENKKKAPLIVGASNFNFSNGQIVTMVGKGTRAIVYPEKLDFDTIKISLNPLTIAPKQSTSAYVIAGDPTDAFDEQPIKSTGESFSAGVALVRPETLLSSLLLQHPDAYLRYDDLADPGIKRLVDIEVDAWNGENETKLGPKEYFNLKMAYAYARIAAVADSSKKSAPVYVRAPEIRSDEHPPVLVYKRDETGEIEIDDEGNFKTILSLPAYANPMIAGHGAPVYSNTQEHILDSYIESLKIARNQIGATNIVPFMPFISRKSEIVYLAQKLKESGFEPPYAAMIEVPSIIELIPTLAEYGFTKLSIGLNDLTQMLFGQDRDTMGEYPIDWQNITFIANLKRVMWLAKTNGCTIGFCGQLNTKDPEEKKVAKILYELGIDYMAANPDNIYELNATLFEFHNDQTFVDRVNKRLLDLVYLERTAKNAIHGQIRKNMGIQA